ncbi:hypothetical protein D9M71_496000 [compost metagenome]
MGLCWIDLPQFIEFCQGISKPITAAGLRAETDCIGPDRLFVGLLSKGAITKRRHQRELVQIQGTELRIRGEQRAQCSQRPYLQYIVLVREHADAQLAMLAHQPGRPFTGWKVAVDLWRQVGNMLDQMADFYLVEGIRAILRWIALGALTIFVLVTSLFGAHLEFGDLQRVMRPLPQPHIWHILTLILLIKR